MALQEWPKTGIIAERSDAPPNIEWTTALNDDDDEDVKVIA